jgi:hypothetical protein
MAPPFIPYYIDYNVKNLSKTIGVSKKKVTFKFGFANLKAIDEGLVGAHCRGSEHECVFTWSLNSGKRHVQMDGKDVHFSTSGQNGWTSDRTWQHVFSLKVPGYAGTFRCHLISQPAPAGSTIHPFDLRVGGVSIFKFNQIYQLGTQQMVVRQAGGSRASHGGGDEPMSPEERRMLEVARIESMREYQAQQTRSSTSSGPPGMVQPNARTAAAPAGGEDLLMSFNDVASPPIPAGQPPAGMVSSLTIGSEYSNPAGHPGQQPFGYPQQQQQPNGYPQQQYQQPNGYPQQQQQLNGYPQQQQQPNYVQSPPYGSPAGLSQQQSFGAWSASTAPTANTSAMTPYQAQQGQAQPSQFAMNSFTSSTNSYGGMTSSTNSFGGMTAPTQASTKAPSLAASLDPYAAPPADPFASPSAMQSSYGQMPPQQQQPQYGGYNGQPGQFQQLQSPTAESQASLGTYGSNPSFAKPPPTGQPQYQQAGGYGQPPAPGVGYGAPPQYQQQQYQQTGF